MLPEDENYLKKKCKNEKELFKLFNDFAEKKFSSFQVAIIQLKTNWNDVAQVPFLYNVLYRLGGVVQDNVQVSIAVQRVSGLSGGNYWCAPTKNGIALSIQEMPSRIFGSGFKNNNIRKQIDDNCKNKSCFDIFDI